MDEFINSVFENSWYQFWHDLFWDDKDGQEEDNIGEKEEIFD